MGGNSRSVWLLEGIFRKIWLRRPTRPPSPRKGDSLTTAHAVLPGLELPTALPLLRRLPDSFHNTVIYSHVTNFHSIEARGCTASGSRLGRRRGSSSTVWFDRCRGHSKVCGIYGDKVEVQWLLAAGRYSRSARRFMANTQGDMGRGVANHELAVATTRGRS